MFRRQMHQKWQLLWDQEYRTMLRSHVCFNYLHLQAKGLSMRHTLVLPFSRKKLNLYYEELLVQLIGYYEIHIGIVCSWWTHTSCYGDLSQLIHVFTLHLRKNLDELHGAIQNQEPVSGTQKQSASHYCALSCWDSSKFWHSSWRMVLNVYTSCMATCMVSSWSIK